MIAAHSLIVFAALVLLSMVLIALVVVVKKQRRATQVLGVKWLQAMRMMLMHLQVHRGLSAAYLSGNTDLRPQLDEVRAQVVSDIANISQIGDWVNSNTSWQGMTQHWARLSATNFTLPPDKNFNQHCRLIASTLALLDETARRHLLENHSRYGDIKFIWHELLNIAELIGQSRAIGVQVLSLRHHNGQLARHKDQIKRGLVEIEKLVDLPACRRNFSPREMHAVATFVEYVKIHLVENIGPISATEYFHQASATMEVIYQRFDQEIQLLQRQVSFS